MKTISKYLVLIVLFGLSINQSNSQESTYMIPDLGTPGMATYVEFIAPHNKKDFFGADGLYINGDGPVLNLKNADNEDVDYVVIGPKVVSWDGRLLSTHIFVNPDVLPNNFYWNTLSNKYKLNITIDIPGVNTINHTYKFYIVKPFPGKTIANDTLGIIKVNNTKPFGIRSPRGAMIFESLTLEGNIHISMQDCDPDTEGNQAFLPCVLMVKKSITGTNNAVIIADGDGRDGGTGGGGGGGRWADDNIDKYGTDGGNGFTGGGKGGINQYVTKTGIYENVGIGSHKDGQSLNGILPPYQESGYYESAGGGTGYPYGFSGENCRHPGTFLTSDLIGFGGASGVHQDKHGSGGGYATKGKEQDDNNKSGGKIHGNKMLTPFAGGSGGSSGNPEYFPILKPHKYGGAGGGGGGALHVVCPIIENISISANGGDGEDRKNIDGGGGSGGAIMLSIKEEASSVKYSVLGGSQNKSHRTGGEGYVRIETFNHNNQNILSVAPHILPAYSGIAIDTTHFIPRKKAYTLRGKSNGNDCYLYKKVGDGDWERIDDAQEDEWAIMANYDGGDEDIPMYYVLINENAGTGNGINDHNYELKHLLSQAAANILMPMDANLDVPNIDPLPYKCFGLLQTSHIFSFDVTNKGMDDLILDMKNSYFKNNDPQFKLLQPTADEIILEHNEVVTFNIKFVPDGSNFIAIKEIFNLVHSDIIGDNKKINPYPIEFLIDTLININLAKASNYDNNIGTGLLNNQITKTLTYVNQSNTKIEIENIPTVNSPFTIISTIPNTYPVQLNIGDSYQIEVGFTPTEEKEYTGNINVNLKSTPANKCDSEYNFEISGKGAIAEIDYPTQFNRIIHWCTAEEEILEIKILNLSNLINDIIMIPQVPTINNTTDFSLEKSTTKKYPFAINGGDGVTFRVYFDPTGKPAKTYKTNFTFNTDVAGKETITIPITVILSRFDVRVTPNPIDFGDIYVGFDTEIIPFSAKNHNTFFDETIVDISNSSVNLDLKRIDDLALYPDIIEMTKIRGYNVAMTTDKSMFDASNKLNETITFTFDDPCDDEIIVPIIANGLLSEVTLTDEIDYEPMIPCMGKVREIIFENSSNAPYIIMEGTSVLIEDPKNPQNGAFLLHVNNLSQDVGFNDTLFTSIPNGMGSKYFHTNSIALQVDFGKTISNQVDYYPDGEYKAAYTVDIFSNGEIKTYTVDLVGVIEGENKTMTTPVFDKTTAKKTDTQQVTITNESTLWDMDIMSISVTSDNAQNPNIDAFDLSNIIVYPQTLQKDGGQFTFDIEFKPTVDGYFEGNINIQYTMSGQIQGEQCDFTDNIPLSANAGKARTIKLRMDSYENVEPWLDNFKIPIYIKIADGEEELADYKIDKLQIEYNKTLLHIKSATNGAKIVDDYVYHGNNKVLTITDITAQLTTQEVILIELIATTMLGDTTETEIIFNLNNLVLNDPTEVSDIFATNGLLNIDICDRGGDRLLETLKEGASLTVNPNPATDKLTATINMIEVGDYSISIIDMLGVSIEIEKWSNDGTIANLKVIDIDLTSYEKGSYVISVQTPSANLIEKFIIK